MRQVKKTLSIKEYTELLQAKLEGEKIEYQKSYKAQRLLSIILVVLLFIIFPLFDILRDYIGWLTFSLFVVLMLLVGSVYEHFKDKKKYRLQTKRYNEVIHSIDGWDKIQLHAIESWFCVTLMQHHLPQHANERMFRYFELLLYERVENDIFLINCYGDLSIIPDILFSQSKINQIDTWIKEGMKQ